MSLGAATRFVDTVDQLSAANLNGLEQGGNVYQDIAGGNNIRITPVTCLISGTSITYAGVGLTALTPSQTNYLYLNSSGNLVINTTGFPAPSTVHFRLATVVCGASTITSITDSRWKFSAGTFGGLVAPAYIAAGGSGLSGDFSLPNTVEFNPTQIGQLQAVLNALSAAGGGEIWLTQGTYTLTAAITMPATGNISIRGLGPKECVILAGASNTVVFNWTNACANISLRNLTLTGTGAGGILTSAVTVTSVEIERCVITTTGANNDCVNATKAVEWTIQFCTLYPGTGGSPGQGGNGIVLSQTSTNPYRGHRISHNIINVTDGGTAIDLHRQAASGDILDMQVDHNIIGLTNLTCIGINVYPIAGYSLYLCAITGNTIINNSDASNSIGIQVSRATCVSITGNICAAFTGNTNTRPIITTGSGSFGGANGCTATGNVRYSFNGNTPQGFSFDGNTTTAGNT